MESDHMEMHDDDLPSDDLDAEDLGYGALPSPGGSSVASFNGGAPATPPHMYLPTQPFGESSRVPAKSGKKQLLNTRDRRVGRGVSSPGHSALGMTPETHLSGPSIIRTGFFDGKTA
jgi:hypothetical protein